MNLKITKSEHERLLKGLITKHIFGSRLFGTATDNSDTDYIALYDFEKVFGVKESQYQQYPNIHSFQFDDLENNEQYVWMTELQFTKGLLSGDGTMISDVILFSTDIITNQYRLDACRSYKIIKAYCGVAKRDLKLHPNVVKKRFHVMRSVYIANSLMSNIVPTVEHIQYIQENIERYSVMDMFRSVEDARRRANDMLDSGELKSYVIEDTSDKLLDKFLNMNNIGEFRY